MTNGMYSRELLMKLRGAIICYLPPTFCVRSWRFWRSTECWRSRCFHFSCRPGTCNKISCRGAQGDKLLDGGFKYVLFSPLFGEDAPISKNQPGCLCSSGWEIFLEILYLLKPTGNVPTSPPRWKELVQRGWKSLQRLRGDILLNHHDPP